MAKLWQFSRAHSKAAFSEKGQTGDQGKFFTNRPKSKPRLKGRKSTLAQNVLSCNYYALKGQRLEKILAPTAAPKVTKWPSYGNSRKVTQNPHFLKKCKRRTKGNFSKNRPENSLRLKGPKALCRKCQNVFQCLHFKCV